MLLLLAEPNVLLLDEPTNDLDIDTLTELEDLLDGWPGSIVVVSHDRYFLERVTDTVLALTGGGLEFLPGGVDEYLSVRAKQRDAQLLRRRRARAGGAARTDDVKVSAAQQRAGQKELTRLERQISRLTDDGGPAVAPSWPPADLTTRGCWISARSCAGSRRSARRWRNAGCWWPRRSTADSRRLGQARQLG